MSLSKMQIVSIASISGFVLASGALGWFLYDSYTTRSEQEEELASETASFQRFNDAPVFPSTKTIAEAKSNQVALAEWREAARAFASRGDRKLAEETPPIFKQRLADTVRKMRALPGSVGGHIAGQTFQFGFDAYLGEGGVLPDVKDVPRLASQLDVIKLVVMTFAKAGVLEVKEITRIDPPPQDEQQTKGGKKKRAKKDKEAEGPKPVCLEFGLVFMARPDAVVKTLNAFSADSRFLVVKNFALKTPVDDIVSRMEAAKQAKAAAAAAAASGGGRRRRRVFAADSAPTAENPEVQIGALIADPEFGSPAQIEFTLAAWDFGTGGASAKPADEASGKAGGPPPAAEASGRARSPSAPQKADKEARK